MPKVLLQRFRDGQLELVESPIPKVHPNGLLVQTVASVVSPGTERMLLDFGRSNLLEKARKQPGRVAEVLHKASADGIAATLAAVQSKLDEPTPLGYANAGIVREVGAGAMGFRVGDLVASNGPHAEWISVPATLAARAPDGVEPAHAAFATLGSVALQGLRLVRPEFGETFAVIGLGLIGLLAVQLLQSNGCSVLAIDPSSERRNLAATFGATTARPGEDARHLAERLTEGVGLDGALVCAATASSSPIHEAAQMSRTRGRIVLVGVTGLELRRSDFYEKELSFQVSSSFGPGKYDPRYDVEGGDYPIAHVRWTAGRNLAALVAAIAEGHVDAAPLISHRFRYEDAVDAYDSLLASPDALGVVLDYSSEPHSNPPPRPRREVSLRPTTPAGHQERPRRKPRDGRLAVVGAGNYASRYLLPALVNAGAHIETVISNSGTSAAISARRFGARTAGTDLDAVYDDPAIDTVVIATRHDTHAQIAAKALAAGKNVFIEKPLAIRRSDLELLSRTLNNPEVINSAPVLMAGFNRRFAPTVRPMREHLQRSAAPAVLTLTMNAGELPATHWAHDPTIGGGRIVGEACHLIDLARYLVDDTVTTMSVVGLDMPRKDTVCLQMQFRNGSVADIHYLANGSSSYQKERIEIFADSSVMINDNYRAFRRYPGRRLIRRPSALSKQQKGTQEMATAFMAAIRSGGPAPIPVHELFEVAELAIRAQESV